MENNLRLRAGFIIDEDTRWFLIEESMNNPVLKQSRMRDNDRGTTDPFEISDRNKLVRYCYVGIKH